MTNRVLTLLICLINPDFGEQLGTTTPVHLTPPRHGVQSEPTAGVNAIIGTSTPTIHSASHLRRSNWCGWNCEEKLEKQSRKKVINSLKEEVDANVNHRMSAQFNFPDSLSLVCHASLVR